MTDNIDYNYVSVELKKEYNEELIDFFTSNGIPAGARFDLHVTLMYGVNNKENKCISELDPSKEFKAHIIGGQVLGDAFVLTLSSRDIVLEHNRLRECGHEHSFDEYVPHMSVVYDMDEFTVTILKSLTAELAGRELIFTNASFGEKQDD